MDPIFIAVAGGTGAGKSTLCTSLMDEYSSGVGLVQLDDYFKPSDRVPVFKGHINWDHPEALDFNKLEKDIDSLKRGHSVIINTKNERLNPEFKKTGERIPVEFRPKPLILIEGYLILYQSSVRKFFETSIWLDVDHKTRWNRRVHFKYPEYEKEVLIPMHKKFAEPTKKYADHVLDVSQLSVSQVLEKTESILGQYLGSLNSGEQRLY